MRYKRILNYRYR